MIGSNCDNALKIVWLFRCGRRRVRQSFSPAAVLRPPHNRILLSGMAGIYAFNVAIARAPRLLSPPFLKTEKRRRAVKSLLFIACRGPIGRTQEPVARTLCQPRK